MKIVFTKEEIMSNRGCYTEGQIKYLFKKYKGETYTIDQILKSDINSRDKCWFFKEACELTNYELNKFCLITLKKTMAMVEKCLPNDHRYREYVESFETHMYDRIQTILFGNITSELKYKYDEAVKACNLIFDLNLCIKFRENYDQMKLNSVFEFLEKY